MLIQEIYHKPTMWEETYRLVKPSKQVKALVNEHINYKDATIVFVGTGSSEFVNDIAKVIVTQHAKCGVL